MSDPFFEFDHAEAAAYLRQKPKWLYTAASQRQIKHARVGGRLFYRKADLDAFLLGCVREPRRPSRVQQR